MITYSELLNLLGKTSNSAEWKNFLKDKKNLLVEEGSKISRSLVFSDLGIAFLYQDKFDRVELVGGKNDVVGNSTHGHYAGTLPYGVTFGDSREVVSQKFGKRPDVIGKHLL